MADNVEDSIIRLRLDPGNVAPASEAASKSIAKIATAGEVSAKQTAAAMRQLPAQLTDVATQQAGGQNPLLVLLQQGGQVKDSFGGIGPAIRGVAAAISPTTIAMSGLAAVTGAVGLAAYQGAKQQQELRDTIALTGNAAGLTGTRLAELSKRVADGSQQTVGTAREIVIELARTGQVSGTALGSVATAVARVADLTGQDVKRIAADFAGMASGVAKWAAEHNKSFNFISAAQYRYLRQLEEQGKSEEAMAFVGRQLVERLKDQQAELGTLERAWNSVTKAASSAWSAMLNAGKTPTLTDRMQEVQGQVAALEQRLAGTDPNALVRTPQGIRNAADQLREQIAARRDEVANLREMVRLENQQADARARNAAQNRKDIADTIANEGKFPFSAIRDAQGQYKADFLRSEKDVYRQLADAERKAFEEGLKDPLGEFIVEKVIPAERDRGDRRITQEADFLQQMLDENDRAGLQLIEDDKTRGERLIELDKSIALRRARASGLSGIALTEAERLIGERSGIERQQLSRELSRGTYDDLRGAISSALQDASGNPVKTFASNFGRAVYSRLSQSIGDSLARLALGESAGGVGGGLLGLLGSLGGSGSGGDYASTVGAGYLPSHADGLDYVPYDGYRAMLHRGERVLTAAEARAQDEPGRGATFNFPINVRGDASSNTVRAIRNEQAAFAVRMSRSLSV